MPNEYTGISPAWFFSERIDWIAMKDSVRIVDSPDGGKDIVLRIDGSYSDSVEGLERLRDDFQLMVREACRGARRPAN